ncbi:hypothetical protein MXB_577, partial [Myxobolus squamalis]
MTIRPLNDKGIKRTSKPEIHINNEESEESESDVSQLCKKKKSAKCTAKSIEINSADEQERAVLPKIVIKKNPDPPRFEIIETMRDGSCLFRAAAHIIYGSQEKHAILRKMCVDHISIPPLNPSQIASNDIEE